MSNVHTMDLEPWAMSNMGIRPESLRFKTLYASCNDVVDPSPQMMRVEFADKVAPSDPPDRYEQMAIDNDIDPPMSEDMSWDDPWKESLYDQALWDADFDNLYGLNVFINIVKERKLERQAQFEFEQNNLLVHGRKLWFEIPKQRTDVIEGLGRKWPSDYRQARRPRDKGPCLPRRRQMTPSHRSFA